MKKTYLLLLVVALINVTSSIAQSDKEKQLTEIAEKLRNDATGNEYLKTLKPSMDDFQKIFISAEDVGEAWMYTEEMYASMNAGAVKPGAHRSETIVLSVSSADLKAGAKHQMPGGYNWIKDKFKNGITIYGLKFVESGKTSGYSLNAFFYVNNHWVCIPKVYRAFPREE